jgi:hypothetical protein
MKIRYIVPIILIAAFCAGCVSRVISRDPSIKEAGFTSTDKNGKITERKLIWIWQDEYRNKKR